MPAPPQHVCEKLYLEDDRARLAWIDISDWPRSHPVTFLRILDNKDEVEERVERGDMSGHFALVKLIPKDAFKDESWWQGEGRIYAKNGSTKQDWGNRMVPFRVANIHPRDVYNGRVIWYLQRWNIPIKLRMMEDLERREKEQKGFRSDMAGSMAENWKYETNRSDYRSAILPNPHDEKQFKYDQARAHGDIDTSDESIIAHERAGVELLKDGYEKS